MALLAAIPALTPIIGKLIDDFIPDPTAKAQAQAQAAQAQLQAALEQSQAQTDIDKTEAASTSIFVAGWRPFVGWVCGAAFGYQFILQPLLVWLAALVASGWGGHVPAAPALDTGSLITVLMSLLGLGAMRSFDKTQGTASGH
jgi:hypothetical protein